MQKQSPQRQPQLQPIHQTLPKYEPHPAQDYQQHQWQYQNYNEQDDQSYNPLCLESKHNGSRNTPISRLSEATQPHHSQLKMNTQGEKNCCNFVADHLLASQGNRKYSTRDEQHSQIKRLGQMLSDLQCYCSVVQKRNQQLVIALQKQKLKSSHFEQALNILRKQDQHLDKKISEQAQLFVRLRQQFENQKDKNLMLCQKIQNSAAENNYLRELILIANKNYELLQKKYLTVVQRSKKMEQQTITKQKQLSYNMQQMKNLLTNLIQTSNCQSVPCANPSPQINISFGEQDENMLKKMPLSTSNSNTNQKKQIEDIYRKMFIKTLKAKK